MQGVPWHDPARHIATRHDTTRQTHLQHSVEAAQLAQVLQAVRHTSHVSPLQQGQHGGRHGMSRRWGRRRRRRPYARAAADSRRRADAPAAHETERVASERILWPLRLHKHDAAVSGGGALEPWSGTHGPAFCTSLWGLFRHGGGMRVPHAHARTVSPGLRHTCDLCAICPTAQH